MEKNEIYELKIEDMGKDGEGIGHIDGMTVFVKDALPGDVIKVKIIKVKKNLCFGRLEEILVPSEDRIEAKCDKARACGGCVLQHMQYEKQLEVKRNHVKNCLLRIGGIENADEILDKEVVGMEEPFYYRNKMQFPIGKDKEGHAILGFYAGRTHSIIPTNDCVIGHPVNPYLMDAIKRYIDISKASVYDEVSQKGLLRHVLTRVGFTTGEVMVCLVANGDKLPKIDLLTEYLEKAVADYNAAVKAAGQRVTDTEDAAKNACEKELCLRSVMLNINKENTNRILGFQSIVLAKEAFIEDYIGNVKFRISPESFFQVNPVQTKRLYQQALDYAGLCGNEIVWDMYCGIGTISLFLSQKAKKVYGVEIVPQAIEDAKQNAALNNISNAEFFVGKAEDVVTEKFRAKKDGSRADVVVVDPPRKGCDEKLLDTLVEMAPQKIVYVSCDPATLARDVKILSERGYELVKAKAFDQFCHSMHVESVCLLSKVQK